MPFHPVPRYEYTVGIVRAHGMAVDSVCAAGKRGTTAQLLNEFRSGLVDNQQRIIRVMDVIKAMWNNKQLGKKTAWAHLLRLAGHLAAYRRYIQRIDYNLQWRAAQALKLEAQVDELAMRAAQVPFTCIMRFKYEGPATAGKKECSDRCDLSVHSAQSARQSAQLRSADSHLFCFAFACCCCRCADGFVKAVYKKIHLRSESVQAQELSREKYELYCFRTGRVGDGFAKYPDELNAHSNEEENQQDDDEEDGDAPMDE